MTYTTFLDVGYRGVIFMRVQSVGIKKEKRKKERNVALSEITLHQTRYYVYIYVYYMFRPTLKVKENVLKLGLSHLTKRKQTNKNNRKYYTFVVQVWKPARDKVRREAGDCSTQPDVNEHSTAGHVRGS